MVIADGCRITAFVYSPSGEACYAAGIYPRLTPDYYILSCPGIQTFGHHGLKEAFARIIRIRTLHPFSGIVYIPFILAICRDTVVFAGDASRIIIAVYRSIVRTRQYSAGYFIDGRYASGYDLPF